MTFKKLFGFGFILAIAVSAVKIFFYQAFSWTETVGVHYVFWLLTASFSVALVRRLGVISFLEAIVVCSVWMFISIISDVILTAGVLGYKVLIDINFLIGYLLMVVAMFIFHKKRHVSIRRENSKT